MYHPSGMNGQNLYINTDKNTPQRGVLFIENVTGPKQKTSARISRKHLNLSEVDFINVLMSLQE
ncbi:MAG: hypothetical protein WEA56_07840 [Balneolaceae bacterium]